MRFLCIHRAPEPGVPATPKLMTDMGNLIAEMASAGVLIGGFALIRVESREEAIEWGKRFLAVVGQGESEIRQIAEVSDFGPEVTPQIREQEELLRSQLSRR
jgi:hypothetical protein